MAPEKTRIVTGPFDFLGYEIDFEKERIYNHDLGFFDLRKPEEDLAIYLNKGKRGYSDNPKKEEK